MGQCKKSLVRTEIATQPPRDMKLEKPMGPGKTQKPSTEEELTQMCGSTHTKAEGSLDSSRQMAKPEGSDYGGFKCRG